MMNNSNNILITVHRIDENGTISSYRYEEDYITHEVIARIPMSSSNFNINTLSNWNSESNQVNLNYRRFEPYDESLTVIKIGSVEDLNPMNYATEIGTLLNDPSDCKPPGNNLPPKSQCKIPNIPTMVRCQNCDTNFPTKYQYQRHQCEFNADKVVLKPDADIKDIDKGMRIKYDCSTCGKQFVSKNNLDRHQLSHDSTQENVCEHCNKQFVSENRLRIHKENHCKKAGDISKFYRSDVTVWKCIKCNQVFATPASANRHTEYCKEINTAIIIVKAENEQTVEEIQSQEITKTHSDATNENENVNATNTESSTTTSTAAIANKNVAKILTELLLQCEYCNRTYADRNLLLMHQKKHTTEVNYECTTCQETFASYTSATKHWMTKCSDEANLFYLPKMTYCEYCDRTFKSHEILYTHKIKKKHYTPKLYFPRDETIRNDVPNKTVAESKDILVKLIEDVLTTMDVNIVKDKTSSSNEVDDFDKENDKPSTSDEIENFNMPIKQEHASPETKSQETGKKKRGRKRKWPKQLGKGKRVSPVVEEGYKYQCERCVLTFDNIVDMDAHRENEHASNFSCEECGQVVHSAKALVIHSRAHQSLKPYVCEQCGRSYSQTSHLWQHMRFHQGIKPFACPHEGCEARYTIRPDLKDHIRKVHTRERPFKCAVCNKCFLTGSVYYQHRLIHTNDRRYGCDICEKRFFRADALNNHRRIHTDERPYPCEVCGKEFRQKGDRNKHVRTQHPE